MEDYIARFRDLVGQLEYVGMKLDNKVCVYLLMAGLESEDTEWVKANLGEVWVSSEPPRFNTVTGSLLQRGWVSGEGQETSIDLGGCG